MSRSRIPGMGIRDLGRQVATEGIAELFADLVGNSQSYAEQIADNMNPIAGIIRGLQQGLGVQLPRNISDLTEEFIKLEIKLDDLQVDVGRATGLFTKLGLEIEALTDMNRELGVTFDRTAKAMTALDKNFSLLYQQTAQQQAATMRLTFLMENLGAAAEDTGKSLEVFSRGMFSTERAAQSSVKNLINLAREIRFKGGPAQMMKDIAEIGPMIVKFGESSERVMGDLAKHARKTGLEMKQIFDVADQFDTFEGAIEKAGMLNAQFGLGLDSIALMQADDAERRTIIVQRFHELYGAFDNLDRRQKQIMGETLGFGADILSTRKYFEEMPLFKDAITTIENAAVEQTKIAEKGEAAFEGQIRNMGSMKIPGMEANVNQAIGGVLDSFKSLAGATTFISTEMTRQFGLTFVPRDYRAIFDVATGTGQALYQFNKAPTGPGTLPAVPGAPGTPNASRFPLAGAPGFPLAGAPGSTSMPMGQGNVPVRLPAEPGPANLPEDQLREAVEKAANKAAPGGETLSEEKQREILEAAAEDRLRPDGSIIPRGPGTLALAAGEALELGTSTMDPFKKFMTASDFAKAMDVDNVKKAREVAQLRRLARMDPNILMDLTPKQLTMLQEAQSPTSGFNQFRQARALNISQGGGVTASNAGRRLIKHTAKNVGKRAIPIIGEAVGFEMDRRDMIARGMDPTKAAAREGVGAAASLGGGALGATGMAIAGAKLGLAGGPFAAITVPAMALGGAILGGFLFEQGAEMAFDSVAGNEVAEREERERKRAALQVQKEQPHKLADAYNRSMGINQTPVQRRPSNTATIPLTNNIYINDQLQSSTTDVLNADLDVTRGRQVRGTNPPRRVDTQSSVR